MTATFTVTSIEYNEGCTTIDLHIGRVGSGDERMGTSGTLHLSYHSPVNLSPGQLVTLTIEPAETKTGAAK